MSAHEQFADDLALYALGALQGAERSAVETHLKTCADCASELERVRGDLALLAFSTSGAKPPARSRERFISAIAQEARSPVLREIARESAWRNWWRGLEWAAAVAAIVVVGLLVRQNGELRRRLASVDANTANQQQQLEQAKQLLTTLTSPDAERYVLVAGNTPPKPQGRAIYVASNATLVFLASNMPALPEEKIYELWLIPTSGAPIPAGLFRPNAEGSAVIVKPPLPIGVEAKTFAITVEPKEGSAAPTAPPIMVGSRG
jgi:anti-sigma-K factor RskA